MNLLFNHEFDGERNGQAEIKATLGFLDAAFPYENLEPDIRLNTPYLVDIVGQDVYNLIYGYYIIPGTPGTPLEEQLELALGYSRIYILSMAYMDFAPDNDLQHGSNGRSFASTENEKIPWEWQIDKSNFSIKRRAYRALDQLMLLLDGSGWTEWTQSEQYKRANSTFINSTLEFERVFPIGHSGQLFYRLVPIMEDIESRKVLALMPASQFDELKTVQSPTDEQNVLISHIKKALAHLTVGRAMKAFPVEMMPDGLLHREDSRAKSEARAETMQFLIEEGKRHLQDLEHALSVQTQTFQEIDPCQGLDEENKFVDL